MVSTIRCIDTATYHWLGLHWRSRFFCASCAEKQTQHLTVNNKALRLRLDATSLTSSTIRPIQWKTLGTGHGTTLAMGAPDLRIGAALSSIGLNIMELAQGVVRGHRIPWAWIIGFWCLPSFVLVLWYGGGIGGLTDAGQAWLQVDSSKTKGALRSCCGPCGI